VTAALGWWRHACLAGFVIGLLGSPHVVPPAGWLPCLLVAAAAAGLVGRPLLVPAGDVPARATVGAWLACLVAIGSLAGLGVGAARVDSIDHGALAEPAGAEVTATGHVGAVPRRSFGEVRLPLDTDDGKVLVVAREPVEDLAVGAEVEVDGRLALPDDPFGRSQLERAGARLELRADELALTGGARGGVEGVLDRVRTRAEAALGEGTDEEEAALARGFVLGQDDLIDPITREEFNRAGLSHLLAVSGQNVMLLAILAGVILGCFGVGLRARLLLTIALIALYVPVAGGGPSILRAGVMGAAGIVATLAGRPTDRAYLVLLAGALTLLLDPRFGSDVGWQLSFAAVLGIMLWAAPLRDLIGGRLARRLPERLAAPLAEGTALTIAATIATAPLMAHHFEELSPASLPANLIVLPAVAPVMWLGMVIGLLGQISFVPVAPLGAIEGAIVDYVAAVAKLFASADWAQASVPLPGLAAVAAAYVAIGTLALATLAIGRRRRELLVPRTLSLLSACALLLALGASAAAGPDGAAAPPPDTLRITELDVGQGDAILLQPPRGDPILVDGGPPGGAAVDALRDLGVDRLAAAFATHDQLDHVGGLYEVLAEIPVTRLVHARPIPELVAVARAAATRVSRTAEGGSFQFGDVSVDVLWPPSADLEGPVEDLNHHSLVLAARFAGYDALLTGDAELEQTHLDPGPLDVLKVAHHGSDDAGLEALLAHSAPRVALIGVGSENTYGHPTAETTEVLAEHAVCILRTDLDGAAAVELGPAGVSAWTAAGPPPPERPGCGQQSG